MKSVIITIVVLALVALPIQAQSIFNFQNVAPWSPRSGAACGLASALVVASGTSAGNTQLNDVWTSVDGGRNWNLTSATLSLNFPLTVTFNDVFYAFAGRTFFSTVDGVSWSQMTVAAPFPSNIHFAPVIVVENSFLVKNQTVFVIGGYDGLNPLPNIFSSNDLMTWTNNGPYPWSARFGMAATTIEAGTRIVVVGGESLSTFFSDVFVSSIGVTSWIQLSSVGAGFRAGSILVNIDNFLYIFGGQSRTSSGGTTTINQDLWVSSNNGLTFTLRSSNEVNLNGQWGCTFKIGREVILAGGEGIPFSNKNSNVSVGFLFE